jgi:hypothetical protein
MTPQEFEQLTWRQMNMLRETLNRRHKTEADRARMEAQAARSLV